MIAHRQTASAGDALDRALAVLGITASAGVKEHLLTYAAEIVRWSQRIDLTASKDALGFVEGPLFDALTLVPLLPTTGHLVDIGSGGGLPGIPAALLRPALTVTLVEPRQKRAVFLRHAVHLLGLSCAVVEAREESLPASGYDLAVAEAVFPVEEWIVRAPRLVRDNGLVFALCSAPLDEATLPPGIVLEAHASFARLKDGRPRHVVRLRRAV